MGKLVLHALSDRSLMSQIESADALSVKFSIKLEAVSASRVSGTVKHVSTARETNTLTLLAGLVFNAQPTLIITVKAVFSVLSITS